MEDGVVVPLIKKLAKAALGAEVDILIVLKKLTMPIRAFSRRVY